MQGNKQCETLGTVTRSVGNLGLSWLWIEKRTLIGLRRDKAIYLLKELKNPEEIWLQTWFRSSGEIIRTIFPGIEVDLSLYLLHFPVQSCDHYNLKVTLPSPYLVWKKRLFPFGVTCSSPVIYSDWTSLSQVLCLFTHPCGSGWHLLHLETKDGVGSHPSHASRERRRSQITQTREGGYWWPKINSFPFHGGTARLRPEPMKAQMPCVEHSPHQLCTKCFFLTQYLKFGRWVLLYREE